MKSKHNIMFTKIMKNQRPSPTDVAVLHVEPVNHHDDHMVLLQQKITDLEYELMIVRQAAKIGAAHDFTKIGSTIEKLCHERKLTRMLQKELRDLKQSVDEVATPVVTPPPPLSTDNNNSTVDAVKMADPQEDGDHAPVSRLQEEGDRTSSMKIQEDETIPQRKLSSKLEEDHRWKHEEARLNLSWKAKKTTIVAKVA